MPFIRIETSEKITKEKQAALTRELGDAIELIKGKSERWLMLDFSGERAMAFSGDAGRCAMITVKLFGSASDGEYGALTERICRIAEKSLSLPRDRVYVQYEEVSHWGWNGANF